jgi:hypothetical protein
MMKTLLTLLFVAVLGTGLANAQCTDCKCKTKCSAECKCKHDKKAP